MILTIAIGIFILYVIYSCFTAKPKNFPPGPPCLPFIGSVLSMPKEYPHLHMMEWRKKYGSLVGLMFGSTPFVAVCEPKSVLEVLKREEFQMRPDTFSFRARSFKKRLGVFFSDGPFWVEHRRFTVRNLRDFGIGKTSEEGVMHDEVSYLIKKLESSKTVQVSGLFNLPIINILWASLAGTRRSHDDEKFNRMIHLIYQSFRTGNPSGGIIDVMPFLRFIIPRSLGYTAATATNTNLQKFFQEIISEHEKTLVPDSPRDFVDVYLLEKQKQRYIEGSTFTDEALIVTCMDLMSAGVESTGNTLGFSLLYLVLHPEVQKKVHEELDRVVGRDRLVSLADRTSLPYAEAVLTETMRCNTIAPVTAPHRASRDTHIDGYFIPKDTVLMMSIWSLLQDKEHWGDPENFRPERFIGPDGKFVKDDWMANFGAGKRVCVGEALARNSSFVFFTCVMQKFSFSLPPGEPKPSTLALQGFTTAPQPFKVQVELRT